MKSYQDILRDILTNGTYKVTRAVDPTTGKQIGAISVFGRQWRHKLSDGFPLLTTKRVPFRFVERELRWFLRGERNIKSLQAEGVTIWNEWAYDPEQKFGGRKTPLSPDDVEGDVGPAYGVQWRRWERPVEDPIDAILDGNTIDQIKNVIETLKKNPNDRRLLVSAWNPADIGKMGLPPCHYAFQLSTHMEHLPACPASPEYSPYVSKVRGVEFDPMARWRPAEVRECACAAVTGRISTEGSRPLRRLDCMVQMRSTDAFLGLPFNIASYALLTHMIAQVTNMTKGDLIFSFGDLHIYENHLAQVEELLSRTPKALPKLGTRLGIWDIDEFDSDSIELTGYDPHPAIKAPVGV